MNTDLASHIRSIAVVDPHEPFSGEDQWVGNGPADVLADLFSNYAPHDLIAAGATPSAVKRLVDGSDPDIEARFDGVAKAWRASEFTGYQPKRVSKSLTCELYGRRCGNCFSAMAA